jgi:hypothetical protein
VAAVSSQRQQRRKKPHAGGKPRAPQEHTALLRHEVAQQPDATLEELRERVAAAQGP